MALIQYKWNTPANVSKDAKYAVRRNSKGGMEIGLLFRTEDGEEWSMSTGDHPALVEMVNAVKMEATGTPAGSFYINEYRQVIVPAANGTDHYYYAGDYTADLQFKFEGNVISGRAVGENGLPLQPGDLWVGVHPGIPYTLKAGGKDISFKRTLRTNVTREELLSRHTSISAALGLASRIRSVKGFEGGRFYINEFRHLFTPLNSDMGIQYIYMGDLRETDPWYPKWIPQSDPSADL